MIEATNERKKPAPTIDNPVLLLEYNYLRETLSQALYTTVADHNVCLIHTAHSQQNRFIRTFCVFNELFVYVTRHFPKSICATPFTSH